MRDIAAQLRQWVRAGTPFAVGTVIGTSGSAPRPAGAAMAVNADGEVVGSVSGGCVEGAVYETAREVLERPADGVAADVTRYGYSDDDAFAVGLTCGGILDIAVQRADHDLLGPALDRVLADQPVALATVVSGPASVGALLVVTPEGASGSLGDPGLDHAVTADARGMLSTGQTGTRHYGPNGQRRVDDVAVFVSVFVPPPRMVVFGATDFAGAVSRIGVFLGYRVTVCDARPVFATAKRFPEAHEVVCAWPHRHLAEQIEAGAVDERTVLAVLTHDPKFDVPLLEVALRSPAAYVGVMGSRRTHAERLEKLRAAGLSEEELTRMRSPVGLDIGARTPEETAVSIAAELVQARWGGSGRPLGETSGPIHAPAGTPAHA